MIKAGHHGGDAVPRRRGEPGIPQDLGVVVGVDVDEAGHDQSPGGVDLAIARHRLGDLHHLAVGDADIGPDGQGAGAVDDRATSDRNLCGHGCSPSWVWRPTRRRSRRAASRRSTGSSLVRLRARRGGCPR